MGIMRVFHSRTVVLNFVKSTQSLNKDELVIFLGKDIYDKDLEALSRGSKRHYDFRCHCLCLHFATLLLRCNPSTGIIDIRRWLRTCDSAHVCACTREL